MGNMEDKESMSELVVLEEVKYPVSISQIKEFVEKWKDVPELDPLNEDKEQYKLVKSAHLEAVKFRTSIEKKRKDLKAPALEYGKTVDRIAKEYQEMVNPKEIELFTQRNKVEQYEKEQEQKRIDAERERVELIGQKITQLKMIPLDSMGKNSKDLISIYEEIFVPTEEEYQERLDDAITTYKDTMQKLESQIETTQKAEQAEAIQAEAEAKRKLEDAERAEKEQAEREAFEAEKRAFQEQKEAQERVIREQQEEIDRQNTLKEIEAQEQKEAQMIVVAEQHDKELFEKCFKETFLELDTFVNIDNMLNAIIDGKVPNIYWEIDND